MNLDIIMIMAYLFIVATAIGAFGSLLVLFFYRLLLKAQTVRFETYELLYFLIPFFMLACLWSRSDKGKSLGNLVEFLLIGALIPLGLVIRIHLGKSIGNRLAFRVSLLALSIASILIYRYMPILPE